MSPQTPVEAIISFVIITWSTIWQGIALWRAVNLEQRNWFIVMLVLNPLGLLSIAYLFFFAKKKMTWKELKGGFRSIFMTEKK